MKEKVEIEKVLTRKKNGVVPTLMKFQNGRLSAFSKENIHFSRLRSAEDNTKLGALLVANDQIYHGLINDTDASDLTDTYVCVRNKVTNKMTLIPVDQATLKNSIYGGLDQTKRKSLSDELTKMTLLKKYGGRKASRFIKAQETMRMDMTIVQKDLEATIEDSGLQENDSDVDKVYNTVYFDKIRPLFNAEAEKLNEVYQIEDVVPIELLDRLDEEAKTVYQTQIDQIPIKSEFLKELISSIQQTTASTENLLRLKLIIYMDSLLNLSKSRARNLKKAELSQISEKVENNIRDRFSDPNATFGNARTLFSTEKALCHFIVLALLIDNKYQVDAAILSQELNASRLKVYKYAHIVQALPKGKTSMLSLKLPKDVPPLRTNFEKRKRE